MSKHYLYHKDELVLEIANDYSCIIHNFNMLPIGLKYKDVNYDDVMHGWLESRNMSIGRTNAKALLKACGISQRNTYAIAKLYHFASVTDCYWLKDEGDNATWDDVNFFSNKPETLITRTALFGEQQIIPIPSKIHTPEYATQGVAAKAWVLEDDGLWLYKVAKKELAASYILDMLGIPHVPYLIATENELKKYTTQDRIKKIKDAEELVVKCPRITNENVSIVTWEDFSIYCDRNNLNPYDEVLKIDADNYYAMLIADFILGNEDRHEGNWGFFVDNNTGKITSLHPLMDHDHAFCNTQLQSQTMDKPLFHEEAAKIALAQYQIDLPTLKVENMPDGITSSQWLKVIERLDMCKDFQNELDTVQKEDYE